MSAYDTLSLPASDLERSTRSAAVASTMESRSMSGITIKLKRPCVEELLKRYEDLISKDFPGYRNHVYRAIT